MGLGFFPGVKKMRQQRELREAVTQIVETGSKEAPLYPVLQEPVVRAFFGSTMLLLSALRDKPAMVLSLLENNKELAKFWHHVGGDDLWIALTDALVEREMGTYASEIYPVIVVAKHSRSIIWPDIFGTDTHSFNLVTAVEGQPLPLSRAYYMVYHDSLTRVFLELLRRVVNIRHLAYFNTSGILRRYLNYPRYGLHLVEFADFFLVDETTRYSYDFKYDMVTMRETVVAMATLMEPFLVGEVVAGKGVRITKSGVDDGGGDQEIYTQELADELRDLQRMVQKLGISLENPARLLEETVPIKLDKYVAIPYRTLLYDERQGIYATHEAQKQYFVSMLADLEHKKKHYGLHCTICRTETCMIDVSRMRAFCSEACRSQYSLSKSE